jgi:ABC-type antimicrobial peptide transport system permease subunit
VATLREQPEGKFYKLTAAGRAQLRAESRMWSRWPVRFSMTLIGVFAALALVLAIVGLYGVLALIVGQRQREIGVRLALGAPPRTVVRMILREGAAMAGVGVVLGIGGALALTRTMGSLLYGISTTDVWTFGGAAALVATVALGATYVPARRAARVDPRTALVGE